MMVWEKTQRSTIGIWGVYCNMLVLHRVYYPRKPEEKNTHTFCKVGPYHLQMEI